MLQVASAGFVVCASRHCSSMCPDEFGTHLRNAITAATDLSDEGVLPTLDGNVGVSGHLIASVSVLESCYTERVSDYGFKAAVLVDMTGVSVATRMCTYYNWWDRMWKIPNNTPCGADTRLELVDPEVPMLFLAADGKIDPINMIESHTKPSVDALLSSYPNQPLIVAAIENMIHNDLVNELWPWPLTSYPAQLKSVEHIIRFFTYALKGEQLNTCDDELRHSLGRSWSATLCTTIISTSGLTSMTFSLYQTIFRSQSVGASVEPVVDKLDERSAMRTATTVLHTNVTAADEC